MLARLSCFVRWLALAFLALFLACSFPITNYLLAHPSSNLVTSKHPIVVDVAVLSFTQITQLLELYPLRMHPSDERARQSFIYLNILTPDCYNHIDKLPATRLRSRDAAHRRRTNRSPVFTPIVSYHSTLIASPEQISHATQYFQQQASVITTYHQTDGASSTTNPSVTNLSAAPAAQEQGVNTTAESALLSTAAITTSHILLSRGVKDDPSLPSSLSTSPTQQEGRGYNSEDIAVTSIWESNNKRVMTFLGPNGGSGLMSKDTTHPSADERSGRRYGERRASDKIWDGEGELPAEFQTMRDPKRDGRSEESSRKANEWLGLTSRTKSGTLIPDFAAEKELYDKFWMNRR